MAHLARALLGGAMTAPILLAASAAVAQSADAPYRGYGMHRGMWEGGMGGGAWMMGPIMMLLFFLLLIGSAFVIVKLVRGDWGGGKQDRALDILRERLAKGDIDAEEYKARKKVLED